MEEITGKIENWSVLFNNSIIGEIYDDIENRFGDGTCIRTSFIENTENLKEGDIVHTKNSVYLLGSKEK